MNYEYICILSILIVWNSQNSTKAENNDEEYVLSSEEIYNSEYTRFKSQLETLQTSNDLIQQHFEIIQLQIEKQENFLQRLETKIDNISQNFKSMKQNIKNYFVKNKLEQQNQNKYFDDKLQMMKEIKQTVDNEESMLKKLTRKFTNMEDLVFKANLGIQISKLDEKISKNFTVLQNIDKSLTKIVNGEGNKPICTIQHYPKNCAEYNENDCSNNKCRIYNSKYGSNPFLVSCDSHEEGAKWTVIQRRINGSIDFYRDWVDYKNGFGNIDGEFFIGLDKLHALTTLQPVELMILLRDFNDTTKYARYDEFVVGNEIENYKLLKVGEYSGDAGDSFSQHMGAQFSTKDRDNDKNRVGCAIEKKGAWWYDSCFWSNLNGKYYDNLTIPKGEWGICWQHFHGYDYSLKFVQMMIRPRK